ncbi:uncharacterized protein LACBIDRAFT_329808 [Laccaria bicolor S238N-H82]|uniref:Predicted protein n=1 Tax=Laccaria bicolor (strain S238N-H82 / ATCC MYA-4686) TaxID=486041 RepID=B0DJA8_LACBS|nr:uncharacterized protein LACBIDRAFT_329808 [Laccaria bicolor S238N-H82]EDR05371.1 predicted protein [Laccaria bicolor S238N-H82]|eukprot:XP_001883929.1 predicted protein [Laccaria bicolor S238N-H82]
MSAWTPILHPLAQVSEDLDNIIQTSLKQLSKPSSSLTRTSIKEWERQLRERICGQETYWHYIHEWLSKCTGMREVEYLPQPELLQTFLDVNYLIFHGQTQEATLLLASLQKNIDGLRFGDNGLQQHQNNRLEDLTGANSIIIEDPEEVGDVESLEESVSTPALSDQQSPPRKRARVTNTTSTDSTPLTFDAFDAQPIHARGASKWNRLLKENYGFWAKKCLQWVTQLNEAYAERINQDLNPIQAEQHYQNVVNVLRELRQVQKSVYQMPEWIQTVKASNLPQSVHQWSDPRGLALWKADFVKKLFRKNRISETLSLVIHSWIPIEEKNAWEESTVDYPVLKTKPTWSKVSTGKELIRALLKYPDMIPRDAYPSSVYSFLNLRNFQFAIKYWLGYALEAKQYDTTSLTNPDTNEQIYRDALTHIQNIMQHQNNNNNKTDPILKLIFQRTLDFLQLRKKISGHVLQNRQGLNSPCKTCNNLPVEEQCIQTIYVDSSKVVDPSVIGCGVSLAPPEIQLEPLKNPHAKPGSQPKPILKPEDPCLKLVRIEPNLQIIERCGLQVFLMCDKTSKETLDFWVHNAFDKDTLCQLVDHHSKLSNVKKINRGKKFESYSMGKMMGHGSRAAMGGASGDSYTFYAGMEAITQEDINALFNSAEDSMVMSEIARLFHHPLYQELKEASAAGDRLGTSGATLYSCNNYTSPLHCDDDATRGLCAQYQLQAISKFLVVL